MAKNTFYSLGAEPLLTFSGTAYAVISGSPLLYGITPALLTNLAAANTALDTAISDASAAEAAFHAAVAEKNTAMQDVINGLSAISPGIYNNTALTDGQIAATGFQPRDHERTPVVPQTPTDLIANAFANGTVNLSWNRNGNPYGVIFVIEASFDGSAWVQVGSTKTRSTTLSGFQPGTTRWFRIRSTTKSQQSANSTSVAIYGTGEESVTLQLAA